jgi:small subunit ribosomal protein S16
VELRLIDDTGDLIVVVIRLARHGKHKAPFYRVVVADHEMKRDGRHLEVLGTYNPMTDPSALVLNEDRVKYWVGVGAKPSDTVARLIERTAPGYLGGIEKARKEKIVSKRTARKARAKKAGTKAKAAPAKK